MKTEPIPGLRTIIGALSPTPPPEPLSSFVGRRQEIEDLRVIHGKGRLLTLTGPGGCGKTRLGLELTAKIRSDFDAVAFADLAPVHDPLAVPEVVAAALGLPVGAASQAPTLIAAARLLLMIDNAEHLVEPLSGLVADYLARCPNLHILVTSRELLNVDGEQSWRVSSLGIPPADGPRSSRAISTYEAVQLFSVRVAEHQPGFQLSDANAPLIAEICRRLDGIPLALELAAVRARSLAMTEMAKRLDDSFRLLTHGPRTADARHRSLRATMDWSYQLLAHKEQRLLRRLAVFADTFDLSAVEAICSAPEIPREEIADTLHRLIDKSLVMSKPGLNGSLRYGQLEVIRQYCRARLLAAGEAGLTAQHGVYYADLVLRLSAVGLPFHVWAEGITADYCNVQLAMSWAATADPELEMRMVHDLQPFWTMRGAIREARARTRSVIAKEHVRGARLARLYIYAAKWSWLAGDVREVADLIDEAAECIDQRRDLRLAVMTLIMRGLLAVETEDLGTAERLFLESIKLCEESRRTTATDPPHQPEADLLPRQADLAVSLNDVALVHVCTGRPQEALHEAERALETMAETPEWRRPGIRAPYLQTLGSALLASDQAVKARDQFLSALSDAADDQTHQAAIAPMLGLACTASVEGQHVACITLLAAAQRAALISNAGHITQVTPHSEAECRSRAALAKKAAAAAWEQGLRMDLQAAVGFARANCGDPPSRPLAPRKMQIVRLVAGGFSDKEIAQRLSISKRTVEAHLVQLRHQLGLHNRAQVVAWAASTGLLGD